MDDNEQLQAIFEARDETYRQFTQQIVDMLPEVMEAIYYAVNERSPVMQHGVKLRVADVSKMFDKLAISIVLEFPPGVHTIGDEEIEITEENSLMFKWVLHFVYELDVVLGRNRADIRQATLDQMTEKEEEQEEKPMPKLKLQPKEHEFDLDDLTPEQREAYILHMRSNPK